LHIPHSFSWYAWENNIHFTAYFIYLCHFRFMLKTVIFIVLLMSTRLIFLIFSFSLLSIRFSFLWKRGGVTDASQHHFSFFDSWCLLCCVEKCDMISFFPHIYVAGEIKI
jgi:hypothetical protein